MRWAAETVVTLFALSACARGPNVASEQLPLRRVVVYRNGVGYFERAGHVEATDVKFRMRQSLIGDFLATLAIVERGGSSVRSASFPIQLEDQVDPRAKEFQELWRSDFAGKLKEKNPLRNVVLRLDGLEHDLAVGYVAETPVWRPSYRVVLDMAGKAELQSWGIIENLSGENWDNIDLVLVAGAPLAFKSNLGQPVTPVRPLVSDTGEVIDSMPGGVTSVASSNGPVDRYEPETQAAPPAPVAAEPMEEADESEEKSEFDNKRKSGMVTRKGESGGFGHAHKKDRIAASPAEPVGRIAPNSKAAAAP